MCREFVGNIEISRFLSGINLNLGPKMREFGRFSSGHTAVESLTPTEPRETEKSLLEINFNLIKIPTF